MPQQNTRRRVRSDRGPALLTTNLEGNSIPAWGPFVYKVAIILTVIAVSIASISTISIMVTILTMSNALNMLAIITTLAALTTQILVSICGLVLLKFVLEYLSRSARIEQRLNEPVVESFQ
jgi:UDP-N-acetylmuramyl pentapeptide phosphotransferase/UDP-N-acetylglucosamine-1-phosphate transferase